MNKILFSNLTRQYAVLREEILDITDSVLSSGRLMDGEYTQQFEKWLADKNDSIYAITCNSGTVALEIIARYYKEKYQSHIKKFTAIIPSLTYPATANAFINAGWNIRFSDVDKYGLLSSDFMFEDDELPIMAVLVGLYGSSIHKIINKLAYNRPFVPVVEDAAQHWLANNSERYGYASAISFDPTKNFGNYGNGGAIVTDVSMLAEYAKEYRNNGKPSNQSSGSNLRMSEVDCAQLMIKTQYIDEWQARRKSIFKYWLEVFGKNGVDVVLNESEFDSHSYHKFVIMHNDRNNLKSALLDKNIETKIHYEFPLFELPAYYSYSNPSISSRASMLSRSVLSLPCYPELTDAEVEYIAENVVKCYS